MSLQFGNTRSTGRATICALLLCLAALAPGAAQQAPSTPPANPPSGQSQNGAKPKPDFHMTPEQARQLFALIDVLLKFSSDETGLPIKSTVKRQMTTRAAVESYLEEKFNDDEGAKRLQRDETVLKKFGMIDRDFQLKPFLLALLKEQIEAYYDSKTKTVNMLDWVDPDEQKPVLAHELTHALQDQHSDLDKWDNQTPDDVSHDAAGDQEHLAKDEMDTARDAVAEGQATAVMMDYILKPLGKSLVKNPEVLDFVQGQMTTNEGSPVMARAPLLLSESMIFPYSEGLSFVQDVWMDQGQAAAFAGTLDRPPTSSWEIMNPREYEHKHIPAVPLLPNIHPLTDPLYEPYDIGQMGQLDVKILTELFGGDNAARDLTPAWDGGLYWAGQLHSAKTPEEQASTKSLALFYLSIWKNADSAQVFARLYADSLGRKYSNLKAVSNDTSSQSSSDGSVGASGGQEQVFSTDEGPVTITQRGKMVFVAESFPLPVARKLTTLIFDAQGLGVLRMAQSDQDILGTQSPGSSQTGLSLWGGSKLRLSGGETSAVTTATYQPLTGDLVQFFQNCGVMKAAVDGSITALAKGARGVPGAAH